MYQLPTPEPPPHLQHSCAFSLFFVPRHSCVFITASVDGTQNNETDFLHKQHSFARVSKTTNAAVAQYGLLLTFILSQK